MPRAEKPTDFTVEVEGVGSFTFARRTMADEMDIQVDFSKVLDGAKPTPWLELVAGCMSALRVLTVRAPAGWNLDELDPLDNETYRKLIKVHERLRKEEDTFRGITRKTRQDGGAGSVQDDSVPVPSTVQTAAE